MTLSFIQLISLRCVQRMGALVAGMVLPWLVGCGLNAYEKNFAAEAERIKKFDEADQALGNPIDYPKNVGTKKQPMYMREDLVFLRPPLGFSGATDTSIQGFLYRYAKDTKSEKIPVPKDTFGPTNEKELGVREIYVAFSTDQKPAEFRAKLEQIFKGAKSLPKRPIDRVGRGQIVFDHWTWSDNQKPQSQYLIFAAQGDANSIGAVVFRIPEDKANTAVVKNAVQYTLQSTVMGSAAPPIRQNFKDRKDGGKKL